MIEARVIHVTTMPGDPDNYARSAAREIKMAEWSTACALKALGMSKDKLCKMDDVTACSVGLPKTITVRLAQEKPWTWIEHLFILID